MAKPYLIFKAHTGFYYAQIRLADGPLSFQRLPKRTSMCLKKSPSGMNSCQVFRSLRSGPKKDVRMPREPTGMDSWIR
ncbi:MAG: hypothetical protein E7059_06440 [Treponema bryantii]|nr:hypothetical protein [Treponema bryantii]